MSELAFAAPRPPTGRWSWGLLVSAHAGLFCAILIPLSSVSTPPLVDYPNHLARMHILSAIAEDPTLDSIYAVEWKALPNLAMDLLIPPLAGLLGADLACRLFLGASFLLIATGTAYLHWTLHRRPSAWPLIIYLFLFNHVTALGFLNYLFGIGLMLFSFALWIDSRCWSFLPRLLLFSLLSSCLFFTHLGAFGAYGLCVLVYELRRALNGEMGSLVQRGVALVQNGLQFAPPLAVLILFSPTMHGEISLRYDLWAKVRGIVSPTLFHPKPEEFVLFAVVLALLLFTASRRWLKLHPTLTFPCIALALALLAVPTWLMDNWGNDLRIALPLLSVILAALSIELPRRSAFALAAVLICLFGYRVSAMTRDWRQYDALFAEFRAASHHFEPGSSILPAVDRPQNVAALAPSPIALAFYNVFALALLERPVFVPTLFTAADRQILSAKPPYQEWDVPHSRPLPPAVLTRAVDPESAVALAQERDFSEHFHAFAGWPRHFDYVAMLDFGQPRNPLPELLRPLHSGSFFTIYQVAAGRPAKAVGG